MDCIVVGGTGTVGSLVVRELVSRGMSVGLLTRKLRQDAAASPGVTFLEGDLANPYSVLPHFKRTERVFLLNAASPSEAYEGVTGALLASIAGVRRLVYLSAHKLHLTPWIPAGGGSKLAVEEAIRAGGLDYTFIRRNNFYQNEIGRASCRERV